MKQPIQNVTVQDTHDVSYVLTDCECDNTHKQNDTVCRWCYTNGRRKYSDPDIQI